MSPLSHRCSRVLISCLLLFASATCYAERRQRTQPMSEAWRKSTGLNLPLAVCVDESQRHVFAAQKQGGLAILDTQQGKEIARIATRELKNLHVMNLCHDGDFVYLALGDHFRENSHAGLAIVDVSNLAAPKALSVWKSKDAARGAAVITVENGVAYLGAMSAGVHILDVNKPKRIRRLTTFLPDIHFPSRNPGRITYPNARGMDTRDGLLYVANDAGGLRVIDVSNVDRPLEITKYINPKMTGKQQAYNSVVLHGQLAYLAVDYAGLEIVDVSNPRKPKQIAWLNPWEAGTLKNLWFNSPGHTNQLALDPLRNELYLSAGDSELLVVDVSEVESPKITKQFGSTKDKKGAWGVGISKNHVFLTYIRTAIPFQGNWSGIVALRR